MDKGPVALLTTVKACADCAHRVPGKIEGFDQCSRSVWHEPVSGEAQYRSCTVERSSALDGACGVRAIHFVSSQNALAARSARRIAQSERLAEAITQFNPSTTDAIEMLRTIKRSLDERYDSRRTAGLIDEAFKEAEEALDELERTLEPEAA